ncbi:hypothetical protein Cs7R123_32760 [Catellatospora sp. TT07R-123]|uniref:S1 RNA-binding domain-containing protein n=1 Tax=Catellatospora sp. TT07R-123 TaxID=2733863 RepID=UPI001B186092|nr:S1 RNA-binding domain-containing protein [Catellatospora sp. TT07R-123]GHJ45934.1 hypothetical protein Cs7R123_32760 [Catellatospora sp. TT07R-123]
MTRDIFAQAARRHAHALPGHILLAAVPCAVPSSVLTVDVLVERAENLESAQKYALRALLYGIDTVEDLQLFLGLDLGDTARALAGLLNAEYIDYRAVAEGDIRRLQLLPAGREAARDAQVRRPKATTYQIVYDRLTEKVTTWHKNALRRASQARVDGRIVLPPATSRHVEVADLSISAVSSTLDHRTRDGVGILGISGVTENRNFHHDGILLIFKDLESDALRLGVEIDGGWSEAHVAALETIGAVDRLGLSTGPAQAPYEPIEHSGERLSKDQVVALQTVGGDVAEQDASDALEQAAIRWLGIYEHPQQLEDALANTQHRLLIVTPAIRQAVVNAAWIRQVQDLARTADVTIVWGSGDNSETDQSCLEALNEAARRSGRLGIIKVNDIRAKVLVSDDTYIKTSFNWLSFRGDGSRKFLQDEGDLVRERTLADAAYDKFMRENCGLATEVVGSLPARFLGLISTEVPWQIAEPTMVARPATQAARPPKRPAEPKGVRREDALSALSAGQVLEGRVKTLTTFGAFVEVGGVDGLVHISELAERRVGHPSEIVSIGDKVTVKVLSVDLQRKRLSLSLKAAR